MSADRERRTSSGSPLRLVGEVAASAPAGEVPAQRAEPLVLGPRAVDLVLPGQRQSVAVGRHWVVRTVLECGVDGTANQVVELLSSELLANAVLHGSEGGAIGVQVHHAVTVLRISVRDGGSRPPVVLHTEPSAPHGRGMAIVEAMSSRWGVDEHDDGGKTVWFELDLADY